MTKVSMSPEELQARMELVETVMPSEAVDKAIQDINMVMAKHNLTIFQGLFVLTTMAQGVIMKVLLRDYSSDDMKA